MDKLAHKQVVINCRYFVAPLCNVCEDALAHNLGAPYIDDVMCLLCIRPVNAFMRLHGWNDKKRLKIIKNILYSSCMGSCKAHMKIWEKMNMPISCMRPLVRWYCCYLNTRHTQLPNWCPLSEYRTCVYSDPAVMGLSSKTKSCTTHNVSMKNSLLLFAK